MTPEILRQRAHYLLGVLLKTALVITLPAGLFGLVWGLAAGLVFLALLALNHGWQLQTLHRWLSHHEPGVIPRTGGAWGQVFAQLYRMEKRTDQIQHKLREALERFQHAGAALPNGVIVFDRSDRIIWCNPSAERQFDIQLDQDRGQSLTYLIRRQEFGDYLERPTPSGLLILRRVRGTELALAIEVVSLSAEERLLVSHDITQVERDEKIRRDFVANVSHELATPLTVLAGFIETLLAGHVTDPARQQKILLMMEAQATRMRRLVEDLLSLSRLESQQAPPAQTPVSMTAMMSMLLQTAQQLSHGQHQISGTVAAPDAVLGTETELASAFNNLVTNAVRYTPAGGSITLEWAREPEGGVFRVKDTGIGFGKEHVSRLTERFYRVDRGRSRDTGGTGLGLAIVKQVVLHHGCRLEIASEPEVGSTFSIHVPAARLVTDNTAVTPNRTAVPHTH